MSWIVRVSGHQGWRVTVLTILTGCHPHHDSHDVTGGGSRMGDQDSRSSELKFKITNESRKLTVSPVL